MTDGLINIKKALVSDALLISKIENECFSTPWSKKQIEDEITAENAVFLVAIVNNTVVGYVSGRNILGEFYINNIAVTSFFRKNGAGKMLLGELIKTVNGLGCLFLTLEVRASNSAAIKLYKQFGFAKMGERKNFYENPTENAYIYTLYFN